MKALRSSLVLGVAVVLLIPTLIAANEEIIIDVKGMTCGSCAQKIQAALRKLDGVRSAGVDLPLNEAIVVHDPTLTSVQELIDAIDALGYQASLKHPAKAAGRRSIAGTVDGAPAGKSCVTPVESAADADGQLTEEQVSAIADYIVQSIVAGGDTPSIAFTSEQIAEATGISIPPEDEGRIQRAALARLREHPEALARVAAQSSRCSQYDACSLNGDLSNATGEVLEMYDREKQEDGTMFDDRPLPSFEAIDIGLRQVRSEDLLGRPTVLALLAGHCTHSMDTFPILQEMTRAYNANGVRVVAIVLNSGTPDDVAAWVAHYEPEYDVWVHEDASLGDLVGSHLVPTYLFVDAEGRMKEKLVGYKDPGIVKEWISGMLTAETSASCR